MDAIEEVKSRLNIEDIVAEYVELKRAGRNFKGLSPFNNERTPSFMVSPEKQIWHDFSSGRGGNIFSFIMEVEGLDFKGALELLARKAGVDLEQYRSSSSGSSSKLKDRLSEALELATHFYQKQLTANIEALSYLGKRRNFTKQTIVTWRLGYAPNSPQALTKFLLGRGFKADELQKAGLSTQRRGGLSDMFRGRIMIPLADQQGKIIGFTARMLHDDPNAPKYINTPQTPLYDKGRHVYGLHLAKDQMRRQAFVVVAEGNLDVISSHQAGVTNVVATAGTAMTEMHLKALNRFTGDIRLSFDVDQAGINATERVIPMAQKEGIRLSVITVRGGKDPDELIQKDVSVWRQCIEERQYALDWLVERYKGLNDLTSAQGKRAFTDAILQTVRRLSDPVEQDHYVGVISELTKTSQEAVRTKLQQKPLTSPKRKKEVKNSTTAQAEVKAQQEYQRLVDHLLSMVLMQPRLRTLLHTAKAEFFTDEQARVVFDFLRRNPEFAGEPQAAKDLKDVSDYVKILSLQFEELYQGLEINDLQEQATRLKARLIDSYVKNQKHLLAEAMQQASNEQELHELMQKVNDLNQLVKH